MTLWLAVISSVACVLPFWLAQRYGAVHLVSPLHLLSYFTCFGVFLKTIYLLAFDGRLFYAGFVSSDSSVVDGFLYVAIFVLAICAGYVASVRRRWTIDRAVAIESAARVLRPRLIMAVGAGVTGFVLLEMLSVRGLGGLTSAFSLATLDALNSSKVLKIEGVEGYGASGAALRTFLFIPALALAVYIARYTIFRRRADLWPLLALTALNFFIPVLEGKRFGLVDTLALFVFVPSLLGRRFSFGSLAKAILGAVLVFSLFVMMTSFRAHKQATESVVFDPWPAVEQVLSSTYFLDVNVPIVILDRSLPEERFWGATYMYWTFAWVPRQFWPDKPAVSIGPYVKQEVFGIGGTIGGFNPTGPGEAFLNFGWGGIAVGFVLGALFRWLEWYFLSPVGLRTRAGLWAYPLVFFPLFTGVVQSSFSASLVSAVVVLVVLRLLLWATGKRFVLRRHVVPA